ncbi:MAG: hypothetical protein OSJ58_07065 [Dysosmobacter sp.]|nr:hypothetical protein [Dysosmobacter sp.]
MANMSYCRFQNTRNDMEDCLDALREEKPLSRDEANAGRRMFDDILSYCQDNGIIDSYDGETLEAVFDGLVEEDENDE